jgi:tellurite resistance protein
MNRIKNFPISFFAIPMGLAGLSISINMGQKILNIPEFIFLICLFSSLAIFLTILFIYIIKIIKFYQITKMEFKHPVQSSFFPMISISFLLLAIAFNKLDPIISYIFWFTGTILQVLFTFSIINNWIQKTHFTIEQLSPAWFIPAVGNIIIPILGAKYMFLDLNFFTFGFGLSIWLFLMSIFFYRIIFHQPLADKLIPTQFILIAPPAIAFIAYYNIQQKLDFFAQSLYGLSLFFFILLFYQIKRFRFLKFYLSWWAYSFPLAALSIASAINYNQSQYPLYYYLYILILTLLISLIFILSILTTKGICKKNICQEE